MWWLRDDDDDGKAADLRLLACSVALRATGPAAGADARIVKAVSGLSDGDSMIAEATNRHLSAAACSTAYRADR